MYFKHNNNFFHGIVFHHFHDFVKHKNNQGSISKDEFYKIIKFVGVKNILSADIFLEKFLSNKIKSNEVCITFDDALKCQIDIALPVLEDLKIKSFFFVYTSIFEKKPDNLEIFRYFRMHCFENVDAFYKDFFKVLNLNLDIFFKKNEKVIEERKKRYPFYSYEDIKFRLVRDEYLKKNEYEKIMSTLMDKKNFNPQNIYEKLFFDQEDIISLDKLGHTIGLHSHYHHTRKEKLSYQEQLNDYTINKNFLSKLLKKQSNYIKTASHPFGSYNKDTLKVFENLGIALAFKDSMQIEKEKRMTKINNSKFEIAREDHMNILRDLIQ